MKNLLSFVATTIGLVSGVIGILSVSDHNMKWAGGCTALAAISLGTAISLFQYHKGTRRQSLGGNWDETLGIGFRVRPANKPDLMWVSKLQQAVYSKQDAVPLETLQEWFDANPKGFFIICNHLEEAIGHMTFLPIKPNSLERYKKEGPDGIVETEIRGDSLYPPSQSQFITDIYVESIILPKKYRPSVHRAVLRAIPKMVSRVKPKSIGGNILAVAATKDGESLLKNLGFILISRSAARKDHHNMYQAALPEFS